MIAAVKRLVEGETPGGSEKDEFPLFAMVRKVLSAG